MAAEAGRLGIEYLVAGKPMEFWSANMPAGMLLRSACDWHLDPTGLDTIEAFLATQNLTPADVEPISRDFYLSYARWFQARKGIETLPVYVQRLDRAARNPARYRATLDDGRTIDARNVVVAVGFKYFKHMPEELAHLLPEGRYGHSCEEVDVDAWRGRRCLIVGGRQGAYEWAALMHEAGAAAVHVSHRHVSPAFRASDWSWVGPMVEAMVEDPGWFRHLSQTDKDRVSHNLWAEGRLKIEPWLESRIKVDGITIWPETQVTRCNVQDDGALGVSFDTGQTLSVDRVILASGYKVDVGRVPFLAGSDVLAHLAVRDGYPELDEYFQTNLPGLFITSLPAGQDFGPFFGFTISVRTSARLIGQALVR